MDEFLLFTAVGFLAQMVDGACGMAYGLTATTVLVSLGTHPAVASASVHAAEVFTTGASGFAHWRLRNVDPRLVARLALPGMAGGIAGALLASSLPMQVIRPVVSAYLLGMGALILWRAWRPPEAQAGRPVTLLGLGGGFLDAAGGGGWGPIVTSTLIGRGDVPRIAIGSTNAAEFFVTLAITAAFFTAIGLELWQAILGLVVGGVLAAPLAALVARQVPARGLMLLVGLVIMLLSLRSLAGALS
ncbi:sulfite exporter TauE/SafE family protein [Falsiroseomonas tokyonensis]|uniref:Probable membrane transporter protein n=1 Tax=Falsiroseomonas tokyonensis TaxID=430521 RepID=A0ABV7BVV4_9PROT|nr:sulfite exporter TauE/SafE family protein [Falsiroseomonas tokyonensis]MBU8539813.1 sulfite exporter TauE/SafE family protein [Falsiroseomonas tokyonensis]